MTCNTHHRPITDPLADYFPGTERRHYVVLALSRLDAPVTLTDVAAAVGARETDQDPDAVPEDHVERVTVALHHNHLPRLADAGVVEYDADTGTVTSTQFEDAGELVQTARARVR